MGPTSPSHPACFCKSGEGSSARPRKEWCFGPSVACVAGSLSLDRSWRGISSIRSRDLELQGCVVNRAADWDSEIEGCLDLAVKGCRVYALCVQGLAAELSSQPAQSAPKDKTPQDEHGTGKGSAT